MKALLIQLSGFLLLSAVAGSAYFEPKTAARGAAAVVAGTVTGLEEAGAGDGTRVYCGTATFSGLQTRAFAVEQSAWRFETYVSPIDPLAQRGFRHRVTLAAESPEQWKKLCAQALLAGPVSVRAE